MVPTSYNMLRISLHVATSIKKDSPNYDISVVVLFTMLMVDWKMFIFSTFEGSKRKLERFEP